MFTISIIDLYASKHPKEFKKILESIIHIKGKFKYRNIYNKFDIVKYKNEFYVCKNNNVANEYPDISENFILLTKYDSNLNNNI